MNLVIYFEGGGDAKNRGKQGSNFALEARARKGLGEFLEKAGLKGKLPKIIPCGGRKETYEDFRKRGLAKGENCILLVDSESALTTSTKWAHLKDRATDRWEQPEKATEADCHLMVQCMETWFLADAGALASHFGGGFKAEKLPKEDRKLEEVEKAKVFEMLAAATKDCKSQYNKGKNSFEILGKVSPSKVMARSPHAKQFIDEVKRRQGLR